jgi:hypothetical protein
MIELRDRWGEELNELLYAIGGLKTHLRRKRSQFAQLGLASSQRTLRALHVKQPVRRRGPDLPAPRAFGTCECEATKAGVSRERRSECVRVSKNGTSMMERTVPGLKPEALLLCQERRWPVSPQFQFRSHGWRWCERMTSSMAPRVRFDGHL